MMSTSLQGNPFLNFFLTAMMELPASLLFYFIVDRSASLSVVLQLLLVFVVMGMMVLKLVVVVVVVAALLMLEVRYQWWTRPL